MKLAPKPTAAVGFTPSDNVLFIAIISETNYPQAKFVITTGAFVTNSGA